MPRKQTKEEILEKAKLARRNRYAEIKSDPVKYAVEKEKEHQRYLKRKESKKILSIQEMTPTAKKVQRERWRDNFKRYYQRKLLQKREAELINSNTPSGSDTDVPLKIDNDVGQETKEIPPVPIREQGPSNLILLNMKKKIRHLEYILQKKGKVHKLQLQDLERKVDNYRKICQRLKKQLQSPNSKATRLIKDKTKVVEVKKRCYLVKL
ncbi:unnamed protein product [Euphydryas editha]|uniref:Uncharacterized protein n=1 Tax=Euphydryas editha TaxID=104508 RepID=A0AAU9VAN0_EUPED|nr:unnamed protein product [Euphydryas editha]